jgi:hypothetical protein
VTKIKSQRFSAATSSLPFSKTGFVSHGSTRSTLPLGVTILKADWPYQVRCVSMLVHETEKISPGKSNDQ